MANDLEEIRKFNGLWTVEFTSTINRVGKGIVVLSDRRLLGGDSGYYYSGRYDIDTAKFSGELIVVRYDPIGVSVFGNLASFKLSLIGEIDNLHFSAAATIPNMPQFKIRIVGNKKEDL